MSGFDNDIMYAKNADFTSADNQNVLESNGLVTNSQMWIGSTSTNAGGTHINVGTLVSTDSSITFGYSSPNITAVVAGGTTVGKTITGNTGGPLPPTAGNWNIVSGIAGAGSTPVTSAGSGSTLSTTVQISQAIASTDASKIGLSNFNSAQFTVDVNGFVSVASAFQPFTWSDTSGTVTAAVNNGYFITAVTTSTLPASPVEGSLVSYVVDTASLLTIKAAGTQLIRIGTDLSSAGGTAVSTQRGDSIDLVYRASGTTWFARNAPVGGWNVT